MEVETPTHITVEDICVNFLLNNVRAERGGGGGDDQG